MPFESMSGVTDPPPPLRLQEDWKQAKNFTVLEGYRYRDDRRGVRVTIEAGETTDLASIPFFLRWFAGTYGKHTRAAIMHDHLWRRPTANVERLAADGTWRPDRSGMDKIEANRLFRDAMGERHFRVWPVKRWIMWAAVTLDTLWKRWPDQMGVALFLALHALVLDPALFGALAGGHWLAVDGHRAFGIPVAVAIVVLPAPLALLWPRKPLGGLIGSYALTLLILPVVVTLSALAVYLVAEAALYGVKRARRLLGAEVGPIDVPTWAKVGRALRGLPA